jgi:aspartyl-tRNA(Asn)/glutamyl-tRNA(Gln) amidotransferase subunit C
MLENDEVLKLAKLSRLSISEEEIPAVKSHLDKMLNHLEALKALDLSNVEPMTAVETGETVLREDVPVQGFTLEQAFANAPAVENDHFAIPKVIGG